MGKCLRVIRKLERRKKLVRRLQKSSKCWEEGKRKEKETFLRKEKQKTNVQKLVIFQSYHFLLKK